MVNLRLTQNFNLAEFIISQEAARLGIDNTPDQVVIDNLRELCKQILQPLRVELGPLHVSSGFRCLKLNRYLKSSDASQHVLGQAADLQLPGRSNQEIIKAVIRLKLPYDQMIDEYNLSWVHISYSDRHRRQVLKIG